MKITNATPEQKLRALAELDGFDEANLKPCGLTENCDCWKAGLPSYLTSYDAIIPLIQKLHDEMLLKMIHHLGNKDARFAYQILQLTPSQLCDAVLVATGKFDL